jgi:hypothetical protein
MKVTLLSILIILNCNLYCQNLEPKFDCKSGTNNANIDIKNGILKIIEYGFQPDFLNNTFATILNRDFGILVEFPGCRVSQNYSCYNKVMLKAIENKFGTQFLDSIRNSAYLLDSIGLGNRPPLFHIDDYYDYGKKLDSFLYCNLNFSNIDYDTAGHPRVRVKFLVEKDGQLSNFNIVDSSSSKCNIEALRVIMMMPRWLHATRNGVPIEDYAFIDIIFSNRSKRLHCP